MTPERWLQIKSIFAEATKLAPAERGAFIEQQCGGDAELRSEVESLLASFDNSAGFMDQPAVGEVADIIAHRRASLEPGQKVGPYQVIRAIGAGGMGEIFLADDQRLGRQVALKILPAQFTSDPDRARRFKQEARAASALNHPNIITIYEIGELDDHELFIATEYIEGRTLREAEINALDLRGVLDIVIQVARALAAAHSAGIVHRDIKPENVMLRPDGVVKVLDFGLAKLVERVPRTTNSQAETATFNSTTPGLVMGTVNYMSPEQARGLDVDARTDIFSCGALLYELLTGRTPFASATHADTIAAILKQEATPLTEFVPGMPAELQRIAGKMLRKDRDDRYQTAKDLLLDLKELREDLQLQAKLELHQGSVPSAVLRSPTQTGPGSDLMPGAGRLSDPIKAQTTAPTETEARAPRRRVWLGVGAVAVVALVVAGGLWFWRSGSSPLHAVKVAKVTQVTSSPGLDDYPSISPDGKNVAYCSDHTGSFEIYVRSLVPGAKEIQLTSDGQQNFEPAWSPDGQQIAYYSKLKGGIWTMPASGGQPKQLTEFGSAPAWSPDGATIAFQSNPLIDLGAGAVSAQSPSTLWTIPAAGGEPKQITRQGDPPGGHGTPGWSPDGKWIVFAAGNYSNYSTWVISLPGGQRHLIAPESRPGCFAADGNSILFVSDARVSQIPFNPRTGETTGKPVTIEGIAGFPAFVRRLSFSTDGKHLAYSAPVRNETLTSLRLRPAILDAVGAPRVLFHNTSNRTHMPAFSPDGERVAFAVCLRNGTNCDIWQVNRDGSEPTQVTTDTESEFMPSWMPDMTELAYSTDRSGRLSLWAINLSTKRERLLRDTGQDMAFPRVSPDGRQVAYNVAADGAVNVWLADLAGGEPRQLTFDKQMMGFPAWSPDGKWLSFQMQRGDNTHVMVMPSAGGEPLQLTANKGQSWTHGWSPDSDKILFAGFRDGVWNVWWVSRTTKKLQMLTNYTKLNSFVRYPAWSPKGDQIAYEYSETTGNVWVADIQ